MKKFFTVIFMAAAIALTAAPLELEHRNCASELIMENQTVRLKKSNAVVGYIQENFVYTCFPFIVPSLAHNAVNEFINHLNGFLPDGGHYVFYSDGRCGFAEPIPAGMSDDEALQKLWNKCQLYKLYPEISRLSTMNVPFELALYTVKTYPPEQRTPAALDDIQALANWENELLGCMPPEDFKVREVKLKPLDFNGKSVDEDVKNIRQKLNDAIIYAGSVDLAVIYATLGSAKGDAYSQYRLAWLMEEKLEQDPEVIFQLYKSAVSKNCLEAIPYLARCYWFGTGTPVDRRKAFEMAAEYLKTDPESLHAKLLTGLWYFYESGDRAKGWALIKECAAYEKFFMPAQLEEALIAEFGLGGRPQEIKWSNNFNPFPGETVHFWRNGCMLNARDRERWFKCGGGDF